MAQDRYRCQRFGRNSNKHRLRFAHYFDYNSRWHLHCRSLQSYRSVSGDSSDPVVLLEGGKSLRISSCKAKGRRCAEEVKALIHSRFPLLEDGDVRITTSSVPGPDLLFSPAAERKLNIVVECKNTEALQPWAAIAQAESYKTATITPVVFFKRNRSKLYAIIGAEDLVDLLASRTSQER